MMNLGVKMIKPFVLCALLLSILPSPANADYDATLSNHKVLIESIKSVGVRFYMNPPSCDVAKKKDIGGIYLHESGRMVICQDDYDGKIPKVKWTENDFDTLRHEAQHIVQDCVAGEIGDGKMSRMFGNGEQFKIFVEASLTEEYVASIYHAYTEEMKVTPYQASMELEAYATANSIPALDISRKLREFCDV